MSERNHNLSRAGLKREARRFKVGDRVTWGNCTTSNVVVEVTRTGLFVDVTDEKDAQYFATRKVDDRLHYFVAFDGNIKCFRGGHGPITKVNA